MMDFIMFPTIMAIIALGIYKLFELFVCKKERLLLIEKMGEIKAMPKFPVPRLYELNHTLRCYLFGELNYIVYLCAINPRYYDYSQERTGSGGVSPRIQTQIQHLGNNLSSSG